MATFKSYCLKCEQVFAHESQARADQALRLHTLRKHGPKHMLGSPRGTAQEKDKPKRKWTRRQPEGPAVRYCPCCGLDLLALTVAVSTVKRMQ